MGRARLAFVQAGSASDAGSTVIEHGPPEGVMVASPDGVGVRDSKGPRAGARPRPRPGPRTPAQTYSRVCTAIGSPLWCQGT